MALHLNLNHELERIRTERRRDPLKLSMYGLAIIAALLVLQYVWTVGKTAVTGHERDKMNRKYAELEPESVAAVAEEAEIKKKLDNSARLQKRIEGRISTSHALPVTLTTTTLVKFSSSSKALSPE
jgi:hypothetical protein